MLIRSEANRCLASQSATARSTTSGTAWASPSCSFQGSAGSRHFGRTKSQPSASALRSSRSIIAGSGRATKRGWATRSSAWRPMSSPAGRAAHQAHPRHRPFHGRGDRPSACDRAPGRLASIVLSATWTKADAYFRRLFTFRKEVLLRLGPSTYLQSATLYWYPSWWVARNNEHLRQLEAQALADLPLSRLSRAASTRCSHSIAPASSHASKLRPW